MKSTSELDILRYRKMPNGRWQVYDRDNRTAEGINKEDAKRQYFLYYKMPNLPIDSYTKHEIIPVDQLTLDTN